MGPALPVAGAPWRQGSSDTPATTKCSSERVIGRIGAARRSGLGLGRALVTAPANRPARFGRPAGSLGHGGGNRSSQGQVRQKATRRRLRSRPGGQVIAGQVRCDRSIRRRWTLVSCAFSFCWHRRNQRPCRWRGRETGQGTPRPVAPPAGTGAAAGSPKPPRRWRSSARRRAARQGAPPDQPG